MSKALIVIDYTNDFIADDGALTCGEPGQAIEPYILNSSTHSLLNSIMLYMPLTSIMPMMSTTQK